MVLTAAVIRLYFTVSTAYFQPIFELLYDFMNTFPIPFIRLDTAALVVSFQTMNSNKSPGLDAAFNTTGYPGRWNHL